MRETLIKLFDLKPEASDDEIVAAARKAVSTCRSYSGKEARERRIAEKIAESCGALNREQAIEVLRSQDVMMGNNATTP